MYINKLFKQLRSLRFYLVYKIVPLDFRPPKRQIINVTVSPLNRISDFISKIDPILAFLIAIGGSFAAILAWFGVKNWRDVSKKEHREDKPQKIEVTIKEALDIDKDSDKDVP